MVFGNYAQQLRQQRHQISRRYSVRQTAQRIGVDPAYLRRVELGDTAPPSEETIQLLAADLGEDADLLLARAGKVASDVRNTILDRPILFAQLIRSLSQVTDEKLKRLVCKSRNSRC